MPVMVRPVVLVDLLSIDDDCPRRIEHKEARQKFSYTWVVMIQPDLLYGLRVSKNHSVYELFATSADDPLTVFGPWQFDSAKDMALLLSRLDMSAVDYIGVDHWLNSASSVEVGNPIKGSMLLEVLGAAPQTLS
jgi:hypothetical protein